MDIMFWIIDLIFPIALVLLGIYFLRLPMEQVTPWKGYRSARALSSPAAYRHGNRTLGRTAVWIGAGLALLAAGLKLLLPMPEAGVSIINLSTQFIGILALFAAVEINLRRRFDSRGRPREYPGKKY